MLWLQREKLQMHEISQHYVKLSKRSHISLDLIYLIELILVVKTPAKFQPALKYLLIY